MGIDWNVVISTTTLGLVAWTLKTLYAMNARQAVLSSTQDEHARRLSTLEETARRARSELVAALRSRRKEDRI